MKQKRIRVQIIPVVGTVFLLDGQRYLCTDITPPTDDRGAVVTWESHCARCGQPMQITTALTVGLFPLHSINRRCPKHVKPFARVRKIALIKPAQSA